MHGLLCGVLRAVMSLKASDVDRLEWDGGVAVSVVSSLDEEVVVEGLLEDEQLQQRLLV